MDRAALEQYLHRQIPLSAAMAVRVVAISADGIELAAPLAPNINHKHTAFGGSLSTLAILAAWSLVHMRLRDVGVACEVVIQSNQMEYDRPVTGDFTARSALADPADWTRFASTLTRRGLARIAVGAEIIAEGAVAGRFSGRFVALRRDG